MIVCGFNGADQGASARRAAAQELGDEVKQAQGPVHGQRDLILDLRERLDRVERQRLSAINPG